MKTKSIKTALLAGMVVLQSSAAIVYGANWKGHSSVTYDLATNPQYGLDPGLAKVMALGAVAPDFFAFANPAAHAQTPDPVPGQKLTKAAYEQSQRESFKASKNLHDYYFNASVQAMKEGHREQAAFLLGYAMHNSEDFATHQGLPNLVHATADHAGTHPDEDPHRIQKASTMAQSDLDAFRAEIDQPGKDDNWKLFKGDEVRGPGLSAKIPEPLVRFGDLDSWDPHSGVIPPAAGPDNAGLSSKIHESFSSAFADVMGKPQTPDDAHLDFRNQAENFVCGLSGRQDQMLGILQGIDPSKQANPIPPPQPPIRRIELDLDPKNNTTLQLFDGLIDFEYFERKRFEDLSAEEQKMLGETDVWRQLVAEELQERHTQVEKWKTLMEEAHQIELQKASWSRRQSELQAAIYAGPPTVDYATRMKAAREEARAESRQAVMHAAGAPFRGIADGAVYVGHAAKGPARSLGMCGRYVLCIGTLGWSEEIMADTGLISQNQALRFKGGNATRSSSSPNVNLPSGNVNWDGR